MTVGRHTYGHNLISIHQWLETPANGNLIIGSFCSIANGVNVFLGGNHRHDWITTFPFGWTHSRNFKKMSGPHIATNGDVVIENDVWIGSNVTIMSGVRIGCGSVIAANSHIVKDVEPYSMVGGNPARLIKQRFSHDVIDKLLKIQWWNWDDEKINSNIDILCSNDLDSLDQFL